MLNELLGLCDENVPRVCPVCGRYAGYIPDNDYWCPYCGPTNDIYALKQVDKLSRRIDLIEKFI
jgi:hypothetical protein